MATYRHPVTGVELNIIDIKRPRKLTKTEAQTARMMRVSGAKVQDIEAALGTNQGRVQDAITTPPGNPAQNTLF